MSLRERLRARIAREGPIGVDDFMTLCLHDPKDGYYATRPRLGETGDFITAPHVSQMFGEIIGLWAAETWRAMGAPARIRLVELGPGDGTMMSDALRAARAVPAFAAACEVWLVETSAPLRARQGQTLAAYPVQRAARLAEVPDDAPMIILANEFLDCLPIRQRAWVDGAWVERRVGVDDRGGLAVLPPSSLIQEDSPALAAFAREIGAVIARTGGAALFIDYGRDAPGDGDTLQALRGHVKEPPLANPGRADLTAHVDFPAFVAAAKDGGAAASAIVTQGDFLKALGIEARAEALAMARPDRAEAIARQLERLIAPHAMGDLFKVVSLRAP